MISVKQSVEWVLARETEDLEEKLHPSAALSTKNPTWNYLGPNPGRCDGKSANKR
jgi:hypothetical protein